MVVVVVVVVEGLMVLVLELLLCGCKLDFRNDYPDGDSLLLCPGASRDGPPGAKGENPSRKSSPVTEILLVECSRAVG